MNIKPKNKILLSQADACFIEKLIGDNKTLVKTIIYSTLGQEHKELFEDALNELYLLICEKFQTIKSHPNPKAWLLVAARYTAQGMKSKHIKHQSENINKAREISDKMDISEEAVYNIWLENNIPQKLINSLTNREKEIYTLIYIKDKKPKEIAKELGITESSVRNIHKNLKDKITEKIKNRDF